MPVITEQCTPLWRKRAWSRHCSPHTSLIAICGHYNPPMIHSRLSECSLHSSGATATGSSTALWLLLLAALLLLMFIPSFYHHKHIILTHQRACSHARSCLSLGEMAQTRVRAHARMLGTHSDYRLSNGGSSHAVSSHQEYPFHLGSILYPFHSSHHFHSPPSISLFLSTLVYQLVSGHQLWIRSLWVNL